MTAPRALTDPELEAFRLSRLVAADRMPYFARALFAVTPFAASGLGTFGVDAAWRLYMDPALLSGPDAWTPNVAAAVLLHEVGHLLRDHAGRAAALPAPLHDTAWNLAADAEINDDLLAADVPLPAGVVTPAALGQPDNDLAERYYEALVPPADQAPAASDPDEPGCGSGAGCQPLPGELAAGATSSTPGLTPAEADLIRRQVAHATREYAQSSGRGTVPAGLERWAGRVLAPPTVPWTRLLRAAVRCAVADRAGRITYTYSRPSRRRVPDIIKPAMRAPALKVSVVVDTSGSMSAADLTAAATEVGGVLRASGIDRDRLLVLCCDAAATEARRVRRLSDLNLTGGGGTDMRIGIAAAEASKPQPDVVIVLTDGDTPWPQRPTRARLVCAVISAADPHGTPPWATTVHVPTGTRA